MNRGVMVTRGVPDTKELELSARGICSNHKDDPVKRRLEIDFEEICSNHSNWEDDPVKRRLEEYFEPLAKAYKKICKKQKREFFGLHDFYR